MGFFTTRKPDDSNDSHQVATNTTVGANGAAAAPGGDKTSVVQVLRSRFYGKKGKEREDPPSYLASVSAAAYSQPVVHNPVASAPPTPGKPGPSILRLDLERPLPSLPPTPTKRRPSVTTPVTPARSAHSKNQSTTSSPTSPRKNIDNVSATLAQRLNALAVANADGLLNDDEYRILRQNLFERFSSTAAVPTETPVVPVAAAPTPRPRKAGPTPDRPSSRPLSNFQVDRPVSVVSRSSVSGMADIFRRATGKKSGSKDMSDASSVWSSSSKTSFFRMPGSLRKKSSASSIHTTSSRIHADQISLSSKGPTSDRGHGDATLTNSRSASSIRQLATPPSSFPGSGARRAGLEHRNTSSIYDVFHEDHLQSVKDIKQEIMNIEAESKRLMDAFNGLEVTTLAKTNRHRTRPSLKASGDAAKSSTAGSNWGGDSDGQSQRRMQLADDAMSMRSGVSVGTTAPSVAPSMARSAYSTKKVPTRVKIAPPSPLQSNASYATSLHRKNSLSSVSSDRRGKMLPPPMPALPSSISHGHLRAASGSNISLVRSTGHLPMNTVHEDEKMSVETGVMEVEDAEPELEDIRRRREEVSQRYDARLEYLRAKLKGAQLHEKLMRK